MKDFCGFRFGNIHTEDLHLVVVSSGDRYDKNLLPNPTDYTTEITGSDGNYYFGQTYSTREFQVEVAFDSVDEPTWRKISQLFSNDKLQDLVFDELPYKTYKAKLSSKPEFKVICFTDKNTKERVYKGEGTLNFICYFPYAFGFNKYVVRAADYYKCLQPQNIIETHSIYENPYKKKERPKQLNGIIKDHYNVKPNMNTPWKGGYPSIEQVQWGELYFNDPTSKEKKMLIDVRGYWDNIPEWEGTAKLLTTPTLDYDRELIYLPQYSKVNYMNMDTGLNRQNGLIGSRILVYNPGDLPVDFELRLGNLSSKFRRNLDNYTFRISRYNVQRLTIDQAVDWTGLKTYNKDDNEEYRYGNRYFTILESNSNNLDENGKIINIDDNIETWDYEPVYKNLMGAHPKHSYMVEPIPRERLGYFIRLFYWQSSRLRFDHGGADGIHGYTCSCDPDNLGECYVNKVIDFEEGKRYADRYEELYDLCITEEEKYELYWKTLKEAIFDRYLDINQYLIDTYGEQYAIFNDDYTYEDFIYDYLYNPPEYIRNKDNLKYGQFNFNITRIPTYYTFDYFDINSKDFDTIQYSCCGCDNCDCNEKSYRPKVQPLFLDTEERMLYNVNDPKWRQNKKWQEDNPDLLDNFFDFKPTKQIFNENIERGHWFKIPPGWSLIDISPIVEEDVWGGKRWLDGRPFYWGKTDENFRKKFNHIYQSAAAQYLSQACPENILKNVDYANIHGNGIPTDFSVDGLKKYFMNLGIDDLENYMQFRRWYEGESCFETYGYMDQSQSININSEIITGDYFNRWKDTIFGLGYEIQLQRVEKAEYGFLKTLSDYWRVNHLDDNGLPIGDVDDWWWYASNYIWANFPPLYWGYADLLNQLQIKYTPLFY